MSAPSGCLAEDRRPGRRSRKAEAEHTSRRTPAASSRVAVEHPVLVRPLPDEALRRGAEVDAENSVHVSHDALLTLLPLLGRAAPQAPTRPGAGRSQDLVHPRRLGRAVRLRHDRLGHDAVLGHECDEHVPLPAVTRPPPRAGTRPCGRPGPVRGLDHRLEEVVGPLDLVPEHEVVLGELELLEIHRLARRPPEEGSGPRTASSDHCSSDL